MDRIGVRELRQNASRHLTRRSRPPATPLVSDCPARTARPAAWAGRGWCPPRWVRLVSSTPRSVRSVCGSRAVCGPIFAPSSPSDRPEPGR